MIKKVLIASLAVLILSACAKTRVVLLPDSDGKVGQVDVSTKAGTTTLTKENESTVAGSENSVPSKSVVANKSDIDSMAGGALDSLPAKPVSFLLYFKFGTDELTEESRKLIPDALVTIKLREPCEVSIIGHSDTMGAADYNIKLSLERAEEIKKLLIDSGVSISKMEVSSHGEHDLLVKTADNVSEPRNRRVEIMVR